MVVVLAVGGERTAHGAASQAAAGEGAGAGGKVALAAVKGGVTAYGARQQLRPRCAGESPRAGCSGGGGEFGRKVGLTRNPMTVG